MSYGTRYLESSKFIDYCEQLNIKTDARELEYYEKKGLMLPRVRVVLPAEYFAQENRWGAGQITKPNDWPQVVRLWDRTLWSQEDYAQLTDEELVDSFDRELDNNPYISRPKPNNFQAWNSYSTAVIGYSEYSCARHYYTYWQAHQLYEIKKYPDLYENRYLLDQFSDEFKEKNHFPRSFNFETYRKFHDLDIFFDALSFFIEIFSREKRRTFSSIPVQHQIQTLNAQQHQEYLQRLAKYAKSVIDKYELTDAKLYKFLVKLLELHTKYLREERLKLAHELENDIYYQTILIGHLNGITEREDIEAELSKITPFWNVRKFRHFDLLAKEYDDSYEVLKIESNWYKEEITKLNLLTSVQPPNEDEIHSILDFCKTNELNLFAYTLSESIGTLDESQKFRRVVRYTNLKNLATSMEYFLKALCEKKGNPMWEKTLPWAIEEIMKNEVWFSEFLQKSMGKLSNTKGNQDTLIRVLGLTTHSEDEYWLRNFWLASLARNLTVHNYPTDDWFYGEHFSEMSHAIIQVIIYSWYVAKREGWVKVTDNS